MKRILFFALLAALVFANFGGQVLAQQGEDNEAYAIKLDPLADINPVKTQHTFVATVLDKQGQPLGGQRVEWILSRSPQAVGDIVEHDDMGAIIGSGSKFVKIDNHYTVTCTNERPVVLTMGTPSTDDDIKLGVGQTWLTITSPVEGETHVIAFCPLIRNANQHKAFAIKYWIDAQIDWPQNAVNKVGNPHVFTFKLSKASTGAPLPGYIVKWTLEDTEVSPPATLGDNPDTKVVDTVTDEAGVSTVTLRQLQTIEGMNHINIELRRPTGELLAIRTVTKQWISPKITVKKNGPSDGILGEKIVYDIEVSNPGEADAKEVVVKDTLPEGFSYLDSSVPPTELNGNQIVWNIGVLAKDDVRKFNISVKAEKVGSWTNTVEVFSKEAPAQTALAVTTIGAPKLYVIKEGPAEVRKGMIATYTLTVKNNGDAVAKQVVLRDEIPAGMKLNDRTTGLAMRWNIDELLPGGTQTYTYTLEAIQVGTFINTAKVFMQGKSTPVHETTCKTRVVAPDLTIVKEGQRLVFLNKPTAYTVTIANNGDGSAKEIVVVDTLPKELDYISSNPKGIFKPAKDQNLATITWKFDEIPAKSQVVLNLEVRANTVGRARNSAKLPSDSPEPPSVEPMEASFDTTIMGVPAMHVNSYDTEDPVELGKQTIYVIETRNEGTSPCTNVILENFIDDEMEYVSASGPTPHKVDKAEDGKQKLLFDPVPILQPGEKLTFKVVCRAIKEGSAKNTAVIRYDQFTKPILDEEGTSVYK